MHTTVTVLCAAQAPDLSKEVRDAWEIDRTEIELTGVSNSSHFFDCTILANIEVTWV